MQNTFHRRIFQAAFYIQFNCPALKYGVETLFLYSSIYCSNMKFVDRKNEIARLTKTLASNESKLIVIYGRRRIGKSTLIRQVLSTSKDIYFQADETQLTNQLHLLAKTIATIIPGFDHATYPNWTSLLEAFNYRITEKITLCLDEFPYLAKSFEALPSVIQHFWDTASPKFNLILCGSSQQSMYADILNEKSPLYGRADCIIKLQPIALPYLQEAMGLSTAKEAVIHYAFWGGVPRYWKLCLDEGSLENALRHLLLTPDGTLSDEPGRLLRDELRDLMLSHTLLSTIGNGANRLSEIAGRLGKNASELTAPLRRLIDMGFIEREQPFGEENKNSKRSLYHIKDEFMDAYYQFVAPNTSLIGMGRENAVWNILKNNMNNYVGHHWERICRHAISGQTIDGITYGAASRWWGTVYNQEKKTGQQIEIDVVAMSIDKKHLLVGECKWTSPEDANRLLAGLVQKTSLLPFAQNVEHIHTVLFLREPPINTANNTIFLPQDIIGML